MEAIKFLLVGFVLPIVINKTTERHRFDFVHSYIREIWTGLLATSTYLWVLNTAGVRSFAMEIHGRYDNHAVLSYTIVGLIGAACLILFWWGTGRLAAQPMQTTAESKPESKAEPGKAKSHQRQLQHQRQANSGGTNTQQQQTNSGGTNIQQGPGSSATTAPSINQTTNAPYSANIVGSNNTLTFGKPSPPRRLSVEESHKLRDALVLGKGHKYRIIATGKESAQYANEIRAVFDAAGWIADGNLDAGAGASVPYPPAGIALIPASSQLTQIEGLVANAFKSINLNLAKDEDGYTGPGSIGRPEVVMEVNKQDD